MSKIILSGAKLKCGEGLAPSSLTVIPKQIDGDDKPVATVQDYKPFVNIAALANVSTGTGEIVVVRPDGCCGLKVVGQIRLR